MEDVYFERIAGVGERKGASPRMPEGAAPVKHSGPPVLNMAHDLDDDLPAVGYDLATPKPAVPQDDVQCDENGFPISPLRDQEDLWFVQAALLYKPLAKGASTARASGMFLLVSGILTVVGGAVGVDMVAVVVGLIVAMLGVMERGAATDLAQAKSSAPFRLALNQILVLALIVVSSWMTAQSIAAKPVLAKPAAVEASVAGLPAEFQGMPQQLNEWWTSQATPNMVYMVFTAIVAVSLVFQGGLALYYFTRRRKVREFRTELPPWVSEIVTTVAMR